jgi:quinol-cytochrome oxidoreductase complex cytochrome b subunit
MENLLTTQAQSSLQLVDKLTAERAIHASIFILLLVGLTVLSVWAISTYLNLQDNLILVIASIPLSWGVILLAMYLSFKKLGWKWWS